MVTLAGSRKEASSKRLTSAFRRSSETNRHVFYESIDIADASFRRSPELRQSNFPSLSQDELTPDIGKKMKSRAAILGHPLHPIFVTIPIGLWSFAPICDLVYHAGWGDDSWKKAAFYCLAGGIAGAIPAIITGWIDVAKFHLIFNLITTFLMAISVWLRWDELYVNHHGVFAQPGAPAQISFSLVPVGISLVAALLVGVSGWLGGELVSTYGISVKGVDERPHGHHP
jgi:uncharacterized membrane protein